MTDVHLDDTSLQRPCWSCNNQCMLDRGGLVKIGRDNCLHCFYCAVLRMTTKQNGAEKDRATRDRFSAVTELGAMSNDYKYNG